MTRFRERLMTAAVGAREARYSRVELPHEAAPTIEDRLSIVVVARILADFHHTDDEETRRPARLLTGASSLRTARDGDTVWGAGLTSASTASDPIFKSLDVRAVRGPLTRDFLGERMVDAPALYGDPVLLLPRLFATRFRASGQRPFVVVANEHRPAAFARDTNFISPVLPWNTYVNRTIESSFVISESLYGLVIADAFGIPARFLHSEIEPDTLTIEDYLLGTGRSEVGAASSVEEALEMGGMPPPVFDADALLSAFPIDLWRDGCGAMDERTAP